MCDDDIDCLDCVHFIRAEWEVGVLSIYCALPGYTPVEKNTANVVIHSDTLYDRDIDSP